MQYEAAEHERLDDGSVDISDFPRQIHWLTQHYVQRIQESRSGYPTIMPVYLPFSGAIDIAAMSSWDGDYAAADAPIAVGGSSRGGNLPHAVPPA